MTKDSKYFSVLLVKNEIILNLHVLIFRIERYVKYKLPKNQKF